MKIEIPASLFVGIAAYLRQLELSLHRAASVGELRRFLEAHSMQPAAVIAALLQLRQKSVPPSEEDWRALAARSVSPLHILGRKVRSWFSQSTTVSICDVEFSATLEALQSADRLLQSNEVELDAGNRLRQMLHTCAELWQLNVGKSSIRCQIRLVEHLNPAQHLVTLPISNIAGPFLDSERSTPRG